MFLIILKYTNGLDKVNQHLEAHRAFLDKYYGLNKFICSGAQVPRVGGVILCSAASRDEVNQIVAEDPFYQNQAADYEVIEFNPVKYAEGFEMFIE